MNVEKITESLKEYDITEKSPIGLLRGSSDNEVFLVGEKDRKILRISKRLPVEDIKFEYEAVQLLLKGGVSVPKWITTKTGNFFILIDGKVAVLFDFLNGNHVIVDKDNLPNQKQAYNAGKGLGVMSNVASAFKPSCPRKRTIYSELERSLTFSNIFINQFEGGKEFIKQVEEVIKFGRNQNEIEGFIHNDYRPSNIFFDSKDEITGIIDFDWSCIGPIIKDLALAVVEWSFPDGANAPDFKTFDAFLEGYNSSATNKQLKDAKLYSWIKFATLSDAATYFCDLADNPRSTKKIIKSYMYKKYTFFSKF